MSTVQVELQDTNRRKIRLLKPLGKGGFGAVYLADVYSPEGLVQRMAVKLLHEEFARDSQLAARARDEARLMSQLNHDHVVKVHALTQVGERAAVLMEYVEGVDGAALLDAADRARERGLPPRVCAAIIEHSASALHAAWTTRSPQTGQPLRVVHRDIKPSNLLLSSGGVVKVMDFGVARAEFEREAQTQSVQFGTQRYMAPERWLHGEAGPESDIYSLGITLWELLTGGRFERLPLQETSYNKRRAEHIEQLRSLQGGEALMEILEAMLAFSPEHRLNAQQVEERLGTLADNLPGPELRRYARKVVPPLVESRLAALANDPDLREISGTLQTRGAPSVTPPANLGGAVATPEPALAPGPPSAPVAQEEELPTWLPVLVGSGAVLAAGLVAVLVWWFALRPEPGP
ncbi:serine/threonine protein kinase, partial [Myxococcota bacterium]|nr:serine/threonine protein kinase [Myxococcota bacterium]